MEPGGARDGDGAGTAPPLVGVVPAAGLASRLGRPTESKELLPVWTPPPGTPAAEAAPETAGDGAPGLPVCRCLLEALRRAGARRAYVVLREGKWDIPACLGDGSDLGVPLAYVMMGRPYGPPFTVDQVHPFVGDAVVGQGFPDILLPVDDTFRRPLARLRSSGADLVLGLFPNHPDRVVDSVLVDADGEVRQVRVDAGGDDRWTWGVAVWNRRFGDFLHRRLEGVDRPPVDGRDAKMGDVVQAAVEAGLRVEGVPVSDEPYLDVGTPRGLAEARRRLGVAGGG